MTKRARILNVLAIAALCLASAGFGQTDKSVDLNELEDRNGVYYYKNKPYSGKFVYSYYCEEIEDYRECKETGYGNVVNGYLHGEAKDIYKRKNGRLEEILNYKNGSAQDGERRYFDANGNFEGVEYLN